MPTPERLAEQFEEHRGYLRTVAYRVPESASEAEDAVQEGWIRLGRTDLNEVENLRAWLTTVAARPAQRARSGSRPLAVHNGARFLDRRDRAHAQTLPRS
jgi:DNA-directed RNA polymerase specialized sigma24 family protein